MFKKICIILASFTVSSMAVAGTHLLLTNYATFSAALDQGDNVKAVIDISKCKTLLKQSADDDIMTGISFDNFIKFTSSSQSYIATTNHVLIKHNEFGYVYDYAEIQVHEDGSVKIYQQFLNSRTKYPEGGEHQYTCSISNGSDSNAVKLYD